MDDKISVIVPVYNVEPYLERCLDSIINNTYKNLEIICVDDGSTDGCGGILDRYAQMDARFVVIHKENGGVSSARNRGLDVATGEYIAFADPDDWIHPQYFEILLQMQKKDNYDLVVCGYGRPEVVEEYSIYDVFTVEGTELNLEGLFENHKVKSYVWGKIYTKNLVSGRRFIEGIRVAEDAAFNVLVLGNYENIRAYYSPLPLYFYYNRPGSLVYSLKGKEMLALAKIYEGFAKDIASNRMKRILLIEVMKRGLSARYTLSLQVDNCEEKLYSDTMVRSAAGNLWKLVNVPIKEKIIYGLFGYLPFTYRLFRIIDDPTLLQMERELKKRNKNKRDH